MLRDEICEDFESAQPLDSCQFDQASNVAGLGVKDTNSRDFGEEKGCGDRFQDGRCSRCHLDTLVAQNRYMWRSEK